MDFEERDRLLAEALQREEFTQNQLTDDELNESLHETSRRFETSIYDLDEDRKLAERLQREEENEYVALKQEIPQKSQSPEHIEEFRGLMQKYKHLSIVDPQWETIDPTPDISAMFQVFDDIYFSGTLRFCTVSWSPRMTSCAGLCCYQGGSCSIRLSRPLLTLRPRSDLVETLLHEMIHAVIFMTGKSRGEGRDGHGPEFHRHMNRINSNAGCKITVYHSFHDEVRYYKVHHWRCDGPCRNRGPFFGWVKRSRNCAPSKNDFWWAKHAQTCGGTFVKVAGPEMNPGAEVAKGRKRKVAPKPSTSQSDGPLAKMLKKVTPSSSQPSAGPSTGGIAKATTVIGGILTKISSFTKSPGRSPSTSPGAGRVVSPPGSKLPPNFKAFNGTGHKLGSVAEGGNASGRSNLISPLANRLRQTTLDVLLSQKSSSSQKSRRSSSSDVAKGKKIIAEFFSSDEEDEDLKPMGTVVPKTEPSTSQVKPCTSRGNRVSSELIVISDDGEVQNDLKGTHVNKVIPSSVQCPVCADDVPESCINAHLDRCLRS